MRRYLLLLILSINALILFAQSDTTSAILIDEVVVTTQRNPEKLLLTPYSISVRAQCLADGHFQVLNSCRFRVICQWISVGEYGTNDCISAGYFVPFSIKKSTAMNNQTDECCPKFVPET